MIYTILAVSSCLAASAVFDYEDFGPQSAVHELIGSQWYQWKSYGDPDPTNKDKIKVVVYWDESLDEIKAKYPVSPSEKSDYRYLKYSKAVSHLNRLTENFRDSGIKTDSLNSTLERLLKLKNKPKD